jgi:hypothetical protein
MRVTVFWNKGRRDGRQTARRFFALSESGGSTKSTSPIGQLKAASHDILQTGQTHIIAPHNPVVIGDSVCVAVIIKSLSGKSTSSSKHRDYAHPILLTFKIFSVCKDFSWRLCGDCG